MCFSFRSFEILIDKLIFNHTVFNLNLIVYTGFMSALLRLVIAGLLIVQPLYYIIISFS